MINHQNLRQSCNYNAFTKVGWARDLSSKSPAGILIAILNRRMAIFIDPKHIRRVVEAPLLKQRLREYHTEGENEDSQ